MLYIPVNWLFLFLCNLLKYNCFFQADPGQHNGQMGLGTEQEKDCLFYSAQNRLR